MAITDDAGNFTLRSRAGSKEIVGLPPGEYRVAISKTAPPDGMSETEYKQKGDAEHALQESKGVHGPTLPPRVEALGGKLLGYTASEAFGHRDRKETQRQFDFEIPATIDPNSPYGHALRQFFADKAGDHYAERALRPALIRGRCGSPLKPQRSKTNVQGSGKA